jgi:formylmethanofuran dehydrogenase subunit B
MEHVTCLGCGCACDDIEVRVESGLIVEARRACALGVSWFGDGAAPARALVDGRDVPVGDALDAAARALSGAARPLVYLAPDLSCEAQRAAVALADLLGASLDSVTSSTAMASVLAAQERGRAAATLGEIRHRADVLVFWGVDPALRYPRYRTRYAPEPAGLYAIEGRASRVVVAVDVGDARGPADADVRVELTPADEVSTLTVLTSLVRLKPDTTSLVRLKPDTTYLDTTHDVRSVRLQADQKRAWAAARGLAPTLLAGRYVVVVADAEMGDGPDSGRAAGLIALVQALNGPTRAALSILRAGGNRSGADAVLTSQTGYPAAVDFFRGYPRYRPFEGSAAARLARREADVVAVIGAAAKIPAQLRSVLAQTQAVVIGPGASVSELAGSHSVVDTGVAGVHDGGTALRMDDVSLPLRRVVSGPPDTAATVRALVDRLTKSDALGASARRMGAALLAPHRAGVRGGGPAPDDSARV